jgi:hypothetical protein
VGATSTDPSSLVVNFDQPILPPSVVATEFSFTGGLLAHSAVASGSTVLVSTSPQAPGNPYTVTVGPGVTNTSGMGVDPSANVATFTGFSCTDGDFRACYTGPPGTSGVGVCRAGVQACANGVFGECVGQVLPSPEVPNGIDDDCDGTTDELP